jgi:hypothetical protein
MSSRACLLEDYDMWNHLLGITEWKKKDSVYSGGTKVKKE